MASQLKGCTSELTQSIGSLAAANATPAPPPDKIDASFKAQLQQAEEKLVHMSKAATLHHQELEETISNLQEQVREHRTYGNDKADQVNALKKQLEEKAVGEALANQDLQASKDESSKQWLVFITD